MKKQSIFLFVILTGTALHALTPEGQAFTAQDIQEVKKVITNVNTTDPHFPKGNLTFVQESLVKLEKTADQAQKKKLSDKIRLALRNIERFAQ